jgi:hypothetical protein
MIIVDFGIAGMVILVTFRAIKVVGGFPTNKRGTEVLF